MAVIKPKIWINVPDQSVFSAQSEGTNDNYHITLSIDSSGPDTDDEEWSDADVKAKRTKVLTSPNTYVIMVRIDFAGDPVPEVTFTAGITRPGGAQHNGLYHFVIQNPQDDSYRAMMGIVTEAGGAQ
jgi:hypothetical protein